MSRSTGAHLVGAYGLFWDRWLVNWNPRQGNTWQLLGRRNTNAPALRVCDFRRARGVYVLYDDYGAKYTGIARGTGGIGQRLRRHHNHEPHDVAWTRFSWFAFDDVVDVAKASGWEEIRPRPKPVPTAQEIVVREIEALLIQVLGTTQNQMRFQRAHRWEQLPAFEAQEMKERGKVESTLFTERPWDHAGDLAR